MRRKLAYILLNCALIAGVGATLGSAVMNMDTDITYGSGRDLYFRIMDHDEERNGLITDINEDDYVQNDDYYAVNRVAEEMEDRLEAWGANASVRKEGYDTVVVSIRTEEDDSVDYSYLQNYLAFSGGNFTVAAGCTDDSVTNDEENPSGQEAYINNNMFTGHTATIEYVNNIPVVAIGVNYGGEDGQMDQLINFCIDNTQEGNEEEGTSTVNCFLVIWSNFRSGDNFAEAYDSSSENYDPNMAMRLVFGENAQSAWYDEDNDDDDYSRLQLVPNSEAIHDGIYDESKAGAAYKAARYYMGLLNASSYADMGQAGENGYDVMFAYSTDINPSVEALLVANAWHWTINSSATAIATLCALLVACVILAVFYRMGSLGIISSLLVSVEGAILILGYFGSQFNVAMLVGLALGGLVAIFGGAYYFSKMREQLYLGRSPKKAHSEASKKAVWPILDAGIISIVIGLCVYYLIPASVGYVGISLVWTSIFATAFNLVVLRFAGWLLANSNKTKEHFGRYYLVDESKVPDAMTGEKPTYEGPFAKTDFQKRKKPTAIILSVLAAASIVGLSVFSAINGNPFNYSTTYEDTTTISMEYRVDPSATTLLFPDETSIQSDFLPEITYFAEGDEEGKTLLDLANTENIVAEVNTVSVSGGETIDQYTVYYFEIPLTQNIPLTEATNNEYHFTVEGLVNAEGETIEFVSINDALEAFTENTGEGIHVNAARVTVQPGIPSLGQLYLGLGIGYLAVAVYLLIRFRSRGFASAIIGFAASLPALGLFALTRLPVSPTIMISAIVASLVTSIVALYITNKELELNHDSREKDKRALAFRNECLEKANAQSAHDVLTYSLLSLAVVLVMFGLVPSTYSLIFIGGAFGIILGVIAVLILLRPLSLSFSKLARSIGGSIRRSNAKQSAQPRGQIGKKQGAEQEETIFIGIND